MFSRNDVRYLHFRDLEKEFNAFKSDRYTLSCHIGLLFGKILDMVLLPHRNRRPHIIRFVADIFFSTLEIGLKKIRNSLPNSLDRRKPYSERISCGLKNVRMRVDGAYV